MKDGHRNDVVITAVFGLVALIAIVTPLTISHSPIRFASAFGAIILGPGTLGCRLATGRRWSECFAIGIPLTVATAMLLGLILVYAHAWYPVPLELLIPLLTCVISGYLLRRELSSPPASHAKRALTELPGARDPVPDTERKA
jgi:uncharacterized membrane protein YfcA